MTASENSKPLPRRRRETQLLIRMSRQEADDARALADKAGLALGAFARASMLGDPGPRAQRRPPADHAALRRILGELGRVGNNINQIAHRLNTGERAETPHLNEALSAYIEIRNAIFDALGMKPPAGESGPVRP